jgi:hypothetical protein
MNLRYTYPPKVILGVLRDMLLRRRRNFGDDSRSIIARLRPPLRIRGEEHIPSRGPCVLVINHYTRRGFHIWWAALAISSVLPSPVHWVIAGEWTAPGKWYEPFKSCLSRFVANRIAHIYDFTSMPPMPPRPGDVAARAGSVRAVLAYGRRNGGSAIIGLAPEGGDQSNGGLMWPAPGLGRFCLMLAAQRLRFVPVGVYESREALCLKFGKAFDLNVCHDLSAEVKDRVAAKIVMSNIAALLPVEFRGEFR